MPRWTRIRGVVVEGHRVASGLAADSPYPRGTIEMQTPFFLERGLDLRAFHPATIGVSCRPLSFTVEHPQYTFRDVRWSPAHHSEDFSFSPCRITVGRVSYGGWIYYPHPETKIGHHHDASTLEIVAPYVEGLGYGTEVELEVDTSEIAISEKE